VQQQNSGGIWVNYGNTPIKEQEPCHEITLGPAIKVSFNAQYLLCFNFNVFFLFDSNFDDMNTIGGKKDIIFIFSIPYKLLHFFIFIFSIFIFFIFFMNIANKVGNFYYLNTN
jgi:hypothetical protein